MAGISRDTAPRWRGMLWGGAALLLALPFVAMRVTDSVDWDAADFVIFGGMLAVACLAVEAVMRLVRTPKWRAVAGLAVLGVFLGLWAELAVGIFGPG